jgi:hypothetical protein
MHYFWFITQYVYLNYVIMLLIIQIVIKKFFSLKEKAKNEFII